MKLYIFTPTYNRGELLERLYASLCSQSNQDFIWLIVDDGSTDDTRQRVDRFVAEGVLTIEYIIQDNGGKHTAYNQALEMMDQEGYHVCIDSDDCLLSEAIENFHYSIHLLEEKLGLDQYVGGVYPRTFISSKSQWIPSKIDKIHIPDILFLYRLHIETTILIPNRICQGFRFRVFPKENFLSEETLYYYLADRGYFYPCHHKVCYTEYLEDGLTNRLFELWRKNYQGTLYSLEKRYEYMKAYYSGVSRWKNCLKTLMNRQALQLTRQSVREMARKEKDKYLLPLSYLWKCFRFK